MRKFIWLTQENLCQCLLEQGVDLQAPHFADGRVEHVLPAVQFDQLDPLQQLVGSLQTFISFFLSENQGIRNQVRRCHGCKLSWSECVTHIRYSLTLRTTQDFTQKTDIIQKVLHNNHKEADWVLSIHFWESKTKELTGVGFEPATTGKPVLRSTN